MTPARRAVVLLSGGLDSATVLAVATDEGFECHALSFRYGGRTPADLDAASRVARAAGVADHVVLDIDLGRFAGPESAGGATADGLAPVASRDAGPVDPPGYVPARNTVFLALALSHAEVIGAQDVFIGIDALDQSGYPDCRPEFVAAFEAMANLATRAAVDHGRHLNIRAPLMQLSKARIVELGQRLGVDHSMTVSCRRPDPDGSACGECAACAVRAKGFRDAGVPDPTRYRSP